jgi:hypothetical protein
VQTVGELDEHHPDVLGHRHQHLADVFRLRLLSRVDVDLAELGHPLDQLGDMLVELAADLVDGDVAVLHGVVKERRRQGLGVEAQPAEQGGHRQRVLHVGFPGEAELPGVGALGDIVGAPQQSAIGLR